MKLPFANKDLGQHFLRDQKIIDSICSNFAEVCDCLIEVGPGPGILTEFLAKIEKPYAVIEKDLRFKEYLEQILDPRDIHFEDALAFPYTQFIENQWGEHDRVWLVSNLPYNISVPLLLKFVQAPAIHWMTLMFQKEVGEKLIFSGKNMNSLQALVSVYFDCQRLCKAPAGAFVPPPQVESVVLSLVKKEAPLLPLEEFLDWEKFLRQLFQFKRKQVFKVLKAHYPKEALEKALEVCQIPTTQRAESFNLDQVLLLYQNLKP